RNAGTNNAIQYLTASIVEEGVRFNLVCFPISSLTLLDRIFEQLINEVKKITPAKIFYLDRWFGNKKYCSIIKLLKHKFVMPITKNKKLKELEQSMKKQTKTKKEEYWISSMNYIFSEDLPREYQVEVKLIILHEDKKVFFFITNIDNLSLLEYYLVSESYSSRFGIETNYRVDNLFCPLSSSVTSSIRYLLMQVSLMIQDLWTLANFLEHKKNMKQPRERYKKDYSIINIVKARIRKLDFIWRPVITAIQFKRQMEKVLG
ncbi:MAG: hypothetical protein Q8N99_08210, partial [Nanoarchaeota archaeon]|nr:hypothetical protein [Nanoarchaeota archaeon]